jgi:preprotein translocase subunit SecB
MRTVFAILTICLLTIFFNGMAFPGATNETSADLDLDLDFDFTIEEVEKKPYAINADIEVEETIRFFDSDALLFKQKYLDTKKSDTFWQTDINITIEGQYEWDMIKLYGRFNSLLYYNKDVSFESERKAEEVYISFQPSVSLAVDVGKKVHKWGKGYAFSPSAFFSRPKNIDDPDATLEGYYSLSADYIKSMTGIIHTLAITPVLMPVTRHINDELGPENELIWGGNFYFFTFDTDLDLMFQVSDNLNDQIGIDFSKNLNPSFEIHGEAALVKDHTKYIFDEFGNISEQEDTAFNFLLGLRYLSNMETTYILEYYHNGEGYTANEYEDYFRFIERGYYQYLNTSNKTAISKSKKYAALYNKQAAMRDYIYLKISQKDPFDILYFTPAIIFIYNVDDQSASITPQIIYSPVTNLTLDLKAAFLTGKSKTEYAEKINRAKVVFSIRYYF